LYLPTQIKGGKQDNGDSAMSQFVEELDAPARKRGPGRKMEYPGLYDAQGMRVALDSPPTDFDPKIHKKLKVNDFTSRDKYLDWQASLHEKIAQELRAEAKDYRENPRTRGRKSRLEALKKRINELTAKLREAGIDVSQILGDQEG
jgi:hypothetical protein